MIMLCLALPDVKLNTHTHTHSTARCEGSLSRHRVHALVAVVAVCVCACADFYLATAVWTLDITTLQLGVTWYNQGSPPSPINNSNKVCAYSSSPPSFLSWLHGPPLQALRPARAPPCM